MTRAALIGNPKAGRGATSWDDLVARLGAKGMDVDLLLTDKPGAAVDLARQARNEQRELVIAAGGDGTVHEVVNGLVDSHAPGGPALGVLPLGSGCDYVKTFDVPENVDDAIAVLTSDKPALMVDIGEIVYDSGHRYFANIAEVGIGPECVARAASLPRSLGGAVYGVAFVLTLPGYRRRQVSIAMDTQTYVGPLTNLVVAIGRVFGGGMRVAPDADPSDGLFDIQIQFGSKLDYVRGLPKVYKGTHIPHPRIRQERATTIEIMSEPPAVLEADGEVLGKTPATFRILPRALKLKA